MRLSQKQKDLYNAIDEILWKDWDPIGINKNEAARDEYQNYTPMLYSLLVKGTNLRGIAERLYQFETTSMGISGSVDRCYGVAQKILQIYQQ